MRPGSPKDSCPDNVATDLELSREEGMGLLVRAAADVAKASSLRCGCLGCRARPDIETFGVACAAYDRDRGTLRLAQQRFLFQFLYADDLQLMAGGERKYDHVWLMGMPSKFGDSPSIISVFSWACLRGGLRGWSSLWRPSSVIRVSWSLSGAWSTQARSL